MRKDKIAKLLPLLNSSVTGYRGSWSKAHCPLVWRHGGKDTNPSFGIEASITKPSRCHCWSCGFSDDLVGLVSAIAEYQKKEFVSGYDLKSAMQLIATELDDQELSLDDIPDYDQVKQELTVFPEAWLSTFMPASKFDEAMGYLATRQVATTVVSDLDLRYDAVQKRVCFPFRGFNHSLYGVQSRAISDDSSLRYYQYGYAGKRNADVWMGEDTVDLDKPVVLVEGPFDYASVHRVYKNVLGSFTSGLSKAKMKRIGDAVEIITMYDYGCGGDAARESLHKHFKSIGVIDVIPTEEQKDPGNMAEDTVYNLLQGYVPLSN